jgi:hypothetical protein
MDNQFKILVIQMELVSEASSLFVWLVTGCWCWFVLREKYFWLVANKANEQS